MRLSTSESLARIGGRAIATSARSRFKGLKRRNEAEADKEMPKTEPYHEDS